MSENTISKASKDGLTAGGLTDEDVERLKAREREMDLNKKIIFNKVGGKL